VPREVRWFCEYWKALPLGAARAQYRDRSESNAANRLGRVMQRAKKAGEDTWDTMREYLCRVLVLHKDGACDVRTRLSAVV
jgi:hypothetical protein